MSTNKVSIGITRKQGERYWFGIFLVYQKKNYYAFLFKILLHIISYVNKMFHFIGNISVCVVRSGLETCIDAMQNKQPIKYGRRIPHSSCN